MGGVLFGWSFGLSKKCTKVKGALGFHSFGCIRFLEENFKNSKKITKRTTKGSKTPQNSKTTSKNQIKPDSLYT